MLRERLGKQRLGGCWVLRPPPTTGFWQQLMYGRLPRRALLMLGVFALVYGLEILGWGVIGQGALDGRLDARWLEDVGLAGLVANSVAIAGALAGFHFCARDGTNSETTPLGRLALGMDLESVQASGNRTVAGALGGLIGLTPAFVSGNASQLELAIGVLLDASDLIRCCAGLI